MRTKVMEQPKYTYHRVSNPKSAIVGYVTCKSQVVTRRRQRHPIRKMLYQFLQWIEYVVLPVLSCVFSAENRDRILNLACVGAALSVSLFFALCLCGSLLAAVNPEAAEALGQFLIALGF